MARKRPPRKAAKELMSAHGIQVLKTELRMEEQERDNWCWAAVAASLHNRKSRTNGDPGAKPLRQIDVAIRVFPEIGADPEKLDRTASLQTALEKVGLFHSAMEGRAPFDEIVKEIQADRPICARIVKDRDGDGVVEGAHFVAISGFGWIDGVEHVQVEDPEGSTFIGPLATFRDNYGKEWTWVATYFVKD
jgi:hypothetical protein